MMMIRLTIEFVVKSVILVTCGLIYAAISFYNLIKNRTYNLFGEIRGNLICLVQEKKTYITNISLCQSLTTKQPKH